MFSSSSSSSSLSIQIPNIHRLSTPKKKAPPLLSDDTKVGSWSDVVIIDMKNSRKTLPNEVKKA